ncbi:MAG: GNAT family N-acetyltransferase [Alphaproteobacteria bacterium]|jgi:ribosomal protein S18 acetylase RimI-like enzyme|nr:GNAT family N-acetyltransferase [Alphaproteobacteria bacterium]
MAEIRVRPAVAADVDWLVGQEARPEMAPFIGRWPAEEHLANLDDPDKHYLIAEDAAGNRLGFVILLGLETPARNVELARIAVTEPGRGLGRPLLRQVIARTFGALGATRLWLDVFDDNARAIRAYEAVGFQDTGERRADEPRSSGETGTLVFMAIAADSAPGA